MAQDFDSLAEPTQKMPCANVASVHEREGYACTDSSCARGSVCQRRCVKSVGECDFLSTCFQLKRGCAALPHDITQAARGWFANVEKE